MTSQVCWLVTLARYVAPEPADSQSLQPSNKKRKKMHPAFTLSVWCQSHVYPWAFVLHSSIALQTSAHVYMEAKGAQRFWQHGLPHAGWRSWGWSFFTCIILWPWKASSHFLCFLQILSEALSVKKSSEIATAFREDGLVGDAINNFGKPAQERDFFRWTLVWPCWYVALLSFRHHVAMHILTCARIRLPIKPYTATNLGSLRSFFVLMKMFSTLTLVLSFDSQGSPFFAQWDWRRKRPCVKCPSFCHPTYCLTSWVKMTLWPRTVYLKMDLMQLVTIGAKKCQVTRQDSVYLMKS